MSAIESISSPSHEMCVYPIGNVLIHDECTNHSTTALPEKQWYHSASSNAVPDAALGSDSIRQKEVDHDLGIGCRNYVSDNRIYSPGVISATAWYSKAGLMRQLGLNEVGFQDLTQKGLPLQIAGRLERRTLGKPVSNSRNNGHIGIASDEDVVVLTWRWCDGEDAEDGGNTNMY